MKKIIYIILGILGIILFGLSMCSCGIEQDQKLAGITNNANPSPIISTDTTENSTKQNSNGDEKLIDRDFGVTFNNTFIKITDNPDKLLESWGRGNVKDDDEAFIGTDPSAKYQRYEYHYLDKDLGINVQIRRGEIDFIYFMDITNWSTNRGIKKGNSYAKMIETYGKPTKEYNEDSELVCEYTFNKCSLMFRFNGDRTISGITIWNYALT